MPIFVIPILLASGLVLVHLGVNGMPVLESDGLTALVLRRRPFMQTLPGGAEPAPDEPRFVRVTRSDVLLADVLTELLELKSEMADMRKQISLLSEGREIQAPGVRHVRRARLARA